MNWILVLSLAFLVFVTVKADLISDVDKYNENFNNMVTTDYEKLIQHRDICLGVFSELSGSATKVISSFIDFQWDTLDDVDKKATTNLLHGITERSKRIHLNCGRLFDILNIESIEEDFYKKVQSPLDTGDLWLRLVNTTTNRAHAKSNFYNYCTNYTFGPIATLDNIALHTYNNCQIPNEVNIDFYFRALDVFKSFEKEFQLDPEYLDLKRGLLRFALFEGDSVGVEEKIQALESIKVDFDSELIEKLKEIEEVDDNNGRCWLEIVFSHSHQRIPDYEHFLSIVLNTLYKADDMLMSCQAMNDSIGFIQEAKKITKLVGDYIDVFKNKMVQKAWPSGIEKRIKEVLPVTKLPESKYNSTTKAIKHAANLMVDKSTKFHVLITDLMEPDNFYTNCVHKSDCLIIQSGDVKAFIFLSKHGLDPNPAMSAEAYYYSTCQKQIKKVIKANAGDNPATIWPLIEAVCPRILQYYRHIFFGTGFKSEGLMKIGWSYAGWNTYQHIHKYYESGQSVTGQDYHLFMMK